MIKKRTIRKTSPTKSEFEYLLNNTKGKNKVLIAALGGIGLRETELAHFRLSWIKTKNSKVYIKIPNKPQKCDCVDCQLQAYFAKERKKQKKDMKWYPECQREFYKLRKSGNLPKLDSYWIPTSKAGARVINFDVPEVERIIVKYFKKHNGIGMSRQAIWQRVKSIGKDVLGKKILPSSLRVTYASMIAEKTNVSTRSLQANMGWAKPDAARSYLKNRKYKIKRR